MDTSPGGAAVPRMISIVVPTLNEVENIDLLLEAVLARTRAANLQIEIIVVDDGSDDGTRDRVRAWEKDHPVRLLARQRRNGLAGAVMAGADAARGEFVLVMDADLSHPPEKVPELIAALLAGTHDMTIGSRHVPGGGSPGWPWPRRLVSRTAAAFAWPFTDAKDPMSGFFALGRDRMRVLGRQAAGFKIGLEILARGGESLRIKEVPLTFVDREHGRSKLDAKVIGTYLRQLALLGGGLVTGPHAMVLGIAVAAGMAVDVAAFSLLMGLAPIAAGTALLASSAAGALAAFAVLGRQWSGAEAPVPLFGARAIAAFLLVAGAAAFLRSGIYALLASSWGLPSPLALICASASGALVLYAGCAFHAFARVTDGDATARRWAVAAVGLIAYLTILRAVYADPIELLSQEAYYWNYGQHLALSYFDHPPMVAWLIRSGGILFGHTELAVRSGAFACTLITMVCAYLFTRDLLGKAAGLRSALLVGILPFFFGIGFFMTPDAPVVACWAGMLFFLGRALLHERVWAWLGVGVCLGLGMLSKYSIALVGVAALLFIVLDRPSRRWLIRPAPYAAVALAALLFLPVILWNYQHDWASFRFQGPERWSRASKFQLHLFVGYVFLIMTPTALAAFCLGLRGRSGNTPGDASALDRRSRLFALVFTLVPLAVFAISSCRNETKMNWTGPAWLAALPVMALTMTSGARASAPWGAAAVASAWKPTIAVLVILSGAAFHFLSFGLPGGLLSQQKLAMCWRDLARQVAAIKDEVAAETGARPLAIGMDKYHASSSLAFYEPSGGGAAETASVHLFGRKNTMYAYWFPGALQKGKSIILVGTHPPDFEDKDVLQDAERLGSLRELPVIRHGQRVATYYARVVYGYRATTAWQRTGMEPDTDPDE